MDPQSARDERETRDIKVRYFLIVIVRRFLKGFGNSNGCPHWFVIRPLHLTKISDALHRLFLKEATRFGELLSAVSSLSLQSQASLRSLKPGPN